MYKVLMIKLRKKNILDKIRTHILWDGLNLIKIKTKTKIKIPTKCRMKMIVTKINKKKNSTNTMKVLWTGLTRSSIYQMFFWAVIARITWNRWTMICNKGSAIGLQTLHQNSTIKTEYIQPFWVFMYSKFWFAYFCF